MIEAIDPTIPADEPGHPVGHRFATGVPTSQCIVCHIHPGTTVMNSSSGLHVVGRWRPTATLIYPKEAEGPDLRRADRRLDAPRPERDRGPARTSTNPEFVATTSSTLNPAASQDSLRRTSTATGGRSSAVFKKDRRGTSSTTRATIIGPSRTAEDSPAGGRTVPMQCRRSSTGFEVRRDDDRFRGREKTEDALNGSCRSRASLFTCWTSTWKRGCTAWTATSSQDVHGNGRLHVEVRAAIEIRPAWIATARPTSYAVADVQRHPQAPDLRSGRQGTPPSLSGRRPDQHEDAVRQAPRFEVRGGRTARTRSRTRCVEKGLRVGK